MDRPQTPHPPAPFRVVVPSSTSNLGCGFDCLGLALERELSIEVRVVQNGARGAVSLTASGTLAEARLVGDERIGRAMAALARRVGRDLPAVEVRADSTIPVARGLGSSGSATVAGMVAADRLLGTGWNADALFALGCELEGHPDNVGPALVGGCVVAMPDSAGRVAWYRTPLHPELRIAVAVPVSRLQTERARAVLPRVVNFDVARNQARKLAQLLRGLEDLDRHRLELGTQDLLHTPYRLPLIRGGEQALDAALRAGAMGAAISGSGSAIVALGKGDLTPVAEAMKAAFVNMGESAEAFVSAVPASGYRVVNLSEASPT